MQMEENPTVGCMTRPSGGCAAAGLLPCQGLHVTGLYLLVGGHRFCPAVQLCGPVCWGSLCRRCRRSSIATAGISGVGIAVPATQAAAATPAHPLLSLQGRLRLLLQSANFVLQPVQRRRIGWELSGHTRTGKHARAMGWSSCGLSGRQSAFQREGEGDRSVSASGFPRQAGGDRRPTTKLHPQA